MSTEAYDYNSLFHPQVEMATEKGSKSLVEYQPTADKGLNGVYKSIIRFVAWYKDPIHSYSSKWSCWLVDPVTNRGRMIDCPSTVGKPSLIQDMFFKLRKSDSVQEQKKAEIFSRKQVYTCVIQVIKDDQNKELEGKLMIWKFGKKLYEKYEAEKKPVMGDAHEPFDLFDGKAFALIITKVSGFNNYDQSKFLDKRIPLCIPDETGKLIPINAQTNRDDVFNFLKTNSPDLDKYQFKEWDQETYDYVNQVIVAVTGHAPQSNNIAAIRNASTEPKVTTSPTINAPTGITSSELTLGDLDTGMSSTLPELDLPTINLNAGMGLGGDLDDALAGL